MKYEFKMTYVGGRKAHGTIEAKSPIEAWRFFANECEGFETDGRGNMLKTVTMTPKKIEWHRTTTGLESNCGYRIERIVDTNVFTGKPQVWGFNLINTCTGDKMMFEKMGDAKWWVAEHM